MSKILITGGSGLIGSALTKALRADGHEVVHLGRKAGTNGAMRTFGWDPSTGAIDTRALEGVEAIVHLSGAPVIGPRWNEQRLRTIDDSRAGAARLLHRAVHEVKPPVKVFVSASGIGWYGARTDDRFHTEEEPAANDTIGTITRNWEEAADLFTDRCRVVKLRTPIVLAKEGGALPRLVAPMRWGPAVPLGTGRQYWPWIHIDDLVRAYVKAISDSTMHGSYNVCAPEQPTHGSFLREAARTMRRPLSPIGVPGWALRIAMGAQADLLLYGTRCSTERMTAAGFRIAHVDLRAALRNSLL